MSALFEVLSSPVGVVLLAGTAWGLAFVRYLRAPHAVRVRPQRTRRSR